MICQSVRRSVHALVCPVHCGKTADQIWMPFGIIGWTCRGMRLIVGFRDRSTGRGNGTFGGEFGTHHCNQWELYGVGVRQCLICWSCGLGWCVHGPRHCCIRWGPRRERGRGSFGGFVPHIHNGKCHWVADSEKCFRFVCENLTTFPFGKGIVGKLDSWAFWQYIHF